MKSFLILIIMLAGMTVANGQEPDTIIDRSGLKYTKNLEDLEAWSWVEYDFKRPDTSRYISLTMTDIFDYERDCFNDSTLSYYWLMSDGGGTLWQQPCQPGDSLAGQFPCTGHWQHKTPFVPFTDFTDWLKRKYGIE